MHFEAWRSNTSREASTAVDGRQSGQVRGSMANSEGGALDFKKSVREHSRCIKSNAEELKCWSEGPKPAHEDHIDNSSGFQQQRTGGRALDRMLPSHAVHILCSW